MLRKLFLLLVLFSSVVGCSRSPSYKGYVPVTQEEATAFAEQLVERTSQGDTSWYLEVAMDIDASAAVCAIAGLDIPDFFRNSTEQEREEWRRLNLEGSRKFEQNLKEIRFKGVEESFNTSVIVFEFIFDKNSEIKISDRENGITLLKKRDTGEIIMAGIGLKL